MWHGEKRNPLLMWLLGLIVANNLDLLLNIGTAKRCTGTEWQTKSVIKIMLNQAGTYSTTEDSHISQDFLQIGWQYLFCPFVSSL